MGLFSKSKPKPEEPKKSEELTSAAFRCKRYTLIFFDDEEKERWRFTNCKPGEVGHYNVSFYDEFGLEHRICGFAYHIEETV